MNAHVKDILQKLESLPPKRQAEAEDFIDFLNARAQEERLTEAAAKVSEPTLKTIWDNADDAEYDRL